MVQHQHAGATRKREVLPCAGDSAVRAVAHLRIAFSNDGGLFLAANPPAHGLRRVEGVQCVGQLLQARHAHTLRSPRHH
ncbi:hypothetical protein D3C87_1913990 [compost metagenome]